MMPPYLSAAEVAERVGVDVRTVHRWIAWGWLPARRVGHRYRIDPQHLQAVDRPAAVSQTAPPEPPTSTKPAPTGAADTRRNSR